ncbi:hypothetical protein M3Y98_00340000 [Aphelenchoides besseyi]|nr:hypothetical protein M3Y98_00340000 [Aphelenchoides besseyi]
MVLAVIRLVGEDEDRFFEGIELDPQMSYVELKKKIENLTKIPADFQQIRFRDQQLTGSPPLKSINGFEEIVVKHSHTDHWTTYLACVKTFEVERNPDLRNEIAEAAIAECKTLKQSSFFDAYTNLRKEWLGLHPPIARHFDLMPKYIKDAATTYFMNKFGIPEACVTCKDVITGTRSAIHCNVNVGQIVYRYRMKTNHGAGTSSRASHFKLNLIELYIYKLLEAIGTGPKVLFIGNSIGGNRIVYIASEFMDGFRTFAQYSDGMSKSENSDDVRKLLVQVHFLSVFLCLSDIKTDNFGMVEENEEKKPIIVDFISTNYQNIKEKFLNRSNCIVGLHYTFADLLQGCNPSDRLKIAQESVNEWGLIAKADEVLKSFNEDKKTFGRVDLEFAKETEDLKTYVKDLKVNLMDLFESKNISP